MDNELKGNKKYKNVKKKSILVKKKCILIYSWIKNQNLKKKTNAK